MKSALDKVHKTAFELEDVKATLTQDLKLSVFDITIVGNQGEILNMPRWVASTLEEEKLVEIEENVNMLNELKQAISKEQILGTFKLSSLEDDFYIKLKYQMKHLSESDLAKTKSDLNRLFRLRRQKIIHHADSSKLTADIANKLAIEEREFYNKLDQIRENFTKQILGDNE